MKPKMRQKATRKKSRRQKATRRTYKKVIKGGDPSNIGIEWSIVIPLFGVIKQGDNDKDIFNTINTYLEMIQDKIDTFAVKKELMPWLENADNAIKRFKKQRDEREHIGYNDDGFVSTLQKRAAAIRKELTKAISDQTSSQTGVENRGKQYREGLNRFRQQLRNKRIYTPRVYIPPKQNGNNLPSAPKANGNNFIRNEFNTMMSKLEQQKAAQKAAQKALISLSEKGTLHAIDNPSL
jgi:hypothetical protein